MSVESHFERPRPPANEESNSDFHQELDNALPEEQLQAIQEEFGRNLDTLNNKGLQERWERWRDYEGSDIPDFLKKPRSTSEETHEAAVSTRRRRRDIEWTSDDDDPRFAEPESDPSPSEVSTLLESLGSRAREKFRDASKHAQRLYLRSVKRPRDVVSKRGAPPEAETHDTTTERAEIPVRDGEVEDQRTLSPQRVEVFWQTLDTLGGRLKQLREASLAAGGVLAEAPKNAISHAREEIHTRADYIRERVHVVEKFLKEAKLERFSEIKNNTELLNSNARIAIEEKEWELRELEDSPALKRLFTQRQRIRTLRGEIEKVTNGIVARNSELRKQETKLSEEIARYERSTSKMRKMYKRLTRSELPEDLSPVISENEGAADEAAEPEVPSMPESEAGGTDGAGESLEATGDFEVGGEGADGEEGSAMSYFDQDHGGEELGVEGERGDAELFDRERITFTTFVREWSGLLTGLRQDGKISDETHDKFVVPRLNTDSNFRYFIRGARMTADAEKSRNDFYELLRTFFVEDNGEDTETAEAFNGLITKVKNELRSET